MTIKFDIKDNKTGKTSTYSKDIITMGEAEKYWQLVEKLSKEENPIKARKAEREFFVDLFKDQGLTEEELLENMSTREYQRVTNEIFREISGQDDEDTENETEEAGKTKN
ncbi:hypothetical protein QP816_12320 [Staphylococcus condimenti]|uniref:phage tail assembly chaperone G n=1 Tax=Staphylococcus condimenti TaxID=70255 RepID=UPI00254DEBA5|nr:hypothetical protein [Staphylococcus condimenti]MDK8646347.1 hypothetical protein [Staphylococcus condimenti]